MNYINFVYLSTYLSLIHTDDINERYAYSTFQGICLPIPRGAVHGRKSRDSEDRPTSSCIRTSSSCRVTLESSSNFPEC